MGNSAIIESERVRASFGRQLALLSVGCRSEGCLADIFAQKGSCVRLPKGRHLQHRGPSQDKLYYVAKGRVLLHLSSPAGKQLAIDIIQPGGLIGFGALRTESFHSFDATTLSACELRCLPAAVLRRELARSVDVCLEMLALSQERLARRALQLEEVALLTTAGRVARLIIREFEAQGVAFRDGAKVSIPSQKLMAQMTGASRETVNKELNILRRNNVVQLSPSKITVVDTRKLKMRAEAELFGGQKLRIRTSFARPIHATVPPPAQITL
jgi:CRP-like cAMP-binding protein